MNVYVDSDVVIASLLSSSGASYLLLHHATVKAHVSSVQKRELTSVCQRLGIDLERLSTLLNKHVRVVPFNKPLSEIKRTHSNYTNDPDDAHIVYGAKSAGTRFLITYNLKHFRSEKIKEDFGIILVTPGQFLQYLRSRS